MDTTLDTLEWKKKPGEDTMALRSEGGLPLLIFPKIEDCGFVGHGFTTRLGGVSTGMFQSLNLSFTRGDERELVMENFRRVAQALGVSVEDFVLSDQTHTVNIREVTASDRGKGLIRERDYHDVDGLITNEPGVALATFYADCVPLFFVDRKRRAIGLSHSGWRGTVAGMALKTVEAMTRAYGSRPEDIMAAIGPSICQDCYEVSEDVAQAVREQFGSQKADAVLRQTGPDKYHLDLWLANVYNMRRAGIPAENIAVTNLCTCCNPELLFSHRASGGKRGNLGAFLYIKR